MQIWAVTWSLLQLAIELAEKGRCSWTALQAKHLFPDCHGYHVVYRVAWQLEAEPSVMQVLDCCQLAGLLLELVQQLRTKLKAAACQKFAWTGKLGLQIGFPPRLSLGLPILASCQKRLLLQQ